MVDICLLGCGGMMPLPERRLAALLYRFNGKMILIDCGEGTQVSVKQAGWGFKAIGAVCFTHYHADHIAGLPGFLLTLGNAGRCEPLKLIGPPGLADVVRGLTVITPNLPYDIQIIELPEDCVSQYEHEGIQISSLPVDHSITCLAYSLGISRPGRFDLQRAQSLGIPRQYWSRLQNGQMVEHAGDAYSPDMVLGPLRKGIKVTYCTDTRPTKTLTAFCRESDVLVCEGMYGEEDKLPSAMEKRHMIFSEAAALAKESASRELWLTHYSPSLDNPNAFLKDAKNIFENTYAGYDLKTKTLKYQEEQ
jgi:ribonuclease Z